MKLPRDVSGESLVKALARLEYRVTRLRGSHVRLTTQRNGGHHVTIPLHSDLRVGTISSILKEIADHNQITRDEVLEQLFGP